MLLFLRLVHCDNSSPLQHYKRKHKFNCINVLVCKFYSTQLLWLTCLPFIFITMSLSFSIVRNMKHLLMLWLVLSLLPSLSILSLIQHILLKKSIWRTSFKDFKVLFIIIITISWKYTALRLFIFLKNL